MTLLTWSHECIVGVEAMDDQHGILMEALNQLRMSLLRGDRSRNLRLQLERLVEFTHMHFQCEEQLLRQQGYPGFDEHRHAHQALLDRLNDVLQETNRTEVIHWSSVLEFLPSWYLDHVEKLDQPYGAWLNDRGVF